jgi:ribonuclease BN (tRNA processing enzyme)
MHLTILGSGTAIPVADRFPASYLVAAPGGPLLVDCGPGASPRPAATSATSPPCC